jgi:hypothetical protein
MEPMDEPMDIEELNIHIPPEETPKSPQKILITVKNEKDTIIQYNHDCPICYEYVNPDFMVVTNCHHSFCQICMCTCIKNAKNVDCPVCRTTINNIFVNNEIQSDFMINFE